MTVPTTAYATTAQGNGATTVFSFSFIADNASTIQVIYTDANGAQTVLSPSVYTLNINAPAVGQLWGIGGTVTYPLVGSPIAVRTSLTIVRNVPYTQTVSIGNQGAFYPQAVEQGLDLLELQIQQLNGAENLELRAPIVDGNLDMTLPSAAARAGDYLGFDGNGLPVAIPGSTALPVDLTNFTAIATGTTTSRSLGNFFSDYAYNVLDFGATGNGVTDDTTAVQTCINTAFANNRNVYLPAGVYLVTGLTLPGTGDNQNQAFRLYGQGAGTVFSRVLSKQTTITSVTNAPVLAYTGENNRGTPNYEIDNIRFEGNSSVPVVYLKSFYNQTHFHHNGIFQTGVGNGFQSDLSNTVELDNCYSINRDFFTPPGGRVGIGFYLSQTLSAGLTSIRKCTSRGFSQAYKLGDGTANRLFSASIHDSECSNNDSGVWLTASCQNCVIDTLYTEGGSGGIGVLDQGNYNTVRSSIFSAGYNTCIDSQLDSTDGSVYTGNTMSLGSVAGSTCMKIQSTGAGGGPGKVASDNMFVFSGSGGSLTNVTGLIIYGIDPRIDLSGNQYNPRGAWVGGAGTSKISNQSTSSDGTTGTGLYGLDFAGSVNGGLECPHLSRGAINLAVEPTTIGLASFSAGVLTVPDLSVFTLTFSGANNITSMIANNLPDKTFTIHCTGSNTVFKQGSLIKLAGSVDFTPGANGAMITSQVFPVNIVMEVSRTAY